MHYPLLLPGWLWAVLILASAYLETQKPQPVPVQVEETPRTWTL